MQKRIQLTPVIMLPLLFFFSCHSGTPAKEEKIATDSLTIASGKVIFNQYCSGCHSMQQNGIGPRLAGLTAEVPAAWIRSFISDPQQLIASGDERAAALLREYKTVMPSFTSLTDEDIDGVMAFIHAHQPPAAKSTKKGLSDPIPERVHFSGLTVNLEEVTQFEATSENGNKPLARITKLDYQPGTGTLFVNDLNGRLYKMKGNKPVVYMDMSVLRPAFINKPGLATGLGSFAFHPDFTRNGLLYTTHTEHPDAAKATFGYHDSIPATVQWVLTEWKVNDAAADRFEGSRELLRVNMASGVHGVQEITFNPLVKPGEKDYGLLYIGIGDGGQTLAGYVYLALDRRYIWSSILRIDPLGRNSANGRYGIPRDNPFAQNDNDTIPPEVYAYGFRNPHRISWTGSGKMLACDIGESNIESLHLIEAGNNYGWPIREGSFVIDPYEDLSQVFPLPADDSLNHISYPVAELDHDETVAISGGYEYSGKNVPLLAGKYFFGDIPSGRLFYVETADLKPGQRAVVREWRITVGGIPKTLVEACGSNRVDLHFGKDAAGELYILTKADGKLYKLTGAMQTQ